MFVKESRIDFTSTRTIVQDHFNDFNGFFRRELGEMGPTVYLGVDVSLIQIDINIIASYKSKNRNRIEGRKEERKGRKEGRKEWKNEGKEGREEERKGGMKKRKEEGRKEEDRTGGRKEGRKAERRTGGRKKGRKDGERSRRKKID